MYWIDYQGNEWKIIPPARTRDRGYIKKYNALRNHVLQRDGFRCVQCKIDDWLTLDHIKPLRVGGTNHPDNCQCLCHSCNAKKVKIDRMMWGN